MANFFPQCLPKLEGTQWEISVTYCIFLLKIYKTLYDFRGVTSTPVHSQSHR